MDLYHLSLQQKQRTNKQTNKQKHYPCRTNSRTSTGFHRHVPNGGTTDGTPPISLPFVHRTGNAILVIGLMAK